MCSACLDADKRLKPQLVGSPSEMEEDSEIQSQRTGSVLSGRDESDTGGLDAADTPGNSAQPGTYYNSKSPAQSPNSPYWLRYTDFFKY